MSYIYLASPYSHPLLTVRCQRYEAVRMAAAWFFRKGETVYSPIAHCHHMGLCGDLPYEEFSGDFWWGHNANMIIQSRVLCILVLPGWKDSVGIQRERDLADKVGKPIWYLHLIGGLAGMLEGNPLKLEIKNGKDF